MLRASLIFGLMTFRTLLFLGLINVGIVVISGILIMVIFSFAPDSYDNFTLVSNSDSGEKLLAQKIFHSLNDLGKSCSHCNFFEVGSGKRLGMLRELSELLPHASFYAVDPVLQGKSLYVLDSKKK